MRTTRVRPGSRGSLGLRLLRLGEFGWLTRRSAIEKPLWTVRIAAMSPVSQGLPIPIANLRRR